ncbi:DUF929 family protein [Actinocrinis puniceicyclus]|uniref:DUF929 family protein n=1 Tax=Actinocrinis puniceicyclus TaxID=977794 RepID=A0A8J8BCY2_9ACTN|nr:DUF929 family protein [Actinocrinis puniceicyclus]MBS2964000.1 DUF929 family protein [Actinocrinis puniceicyclus]
MSSTRPTRTTREERLRKAQAKIAAQREAERRRRRLWLAAGSLLAVVAVFAALVIAKAAGGSHTASTTQSSGLSAADTARVVQSATTVPGPVLDTIGRGTVSNGPAAIAGAPALASGGKPEVLYIGEEWCPYCAAQRWAIVVALSRFGTFSGLGLTQSAGDDVYPNTHTFSFAKTTYSSPYLSFSAVETQDADKKPLQTMTAEQQRLISVYDSPPYVPSSAAGGIPFLDLGGKFMISGASYSPQTLAGKSWSQIASALSDPSSAEAQGIDGSANALTAALCTLTRQQPANVCSAKGVTEAKGALK